MLNTALLSHSASWLHISFAYRPSNGSPNGASKPNRCQQTWHLSSPLNGLPPHPPSHTASDSAVSLLCFTSHIQPFTRLLRVQSSSSTSSCPFPPHLHQSPSDYPTCTVVPCLQGTHHRLPAAWSTRSQTHGLQAKALHILDPIQIENLTAYCFSS